VVFFAMLLVLSSLQLRAWGVRTGAKARATRARTKASATRKATP